MSPRRSNYEVWEDRGGKWGDRFTNHPVLWSLGVIVAIAVVGVVLSFAFGWFNKAAEVAGPENTEDQYNALYDNYNAMKALAAQSCQISESAQNGSSQQAQTFLEDPAISVDNRYRQAEADYNSRSDNYFQAGGIIKNPSDLPEDAPTLEEMKQLVC